MNDADKLTRPRMDDELHQGAEVPVTFSIDPNDRLPVPVAPDNTDTPPPLAVDTFVCMEDKRSFVIRNSDGSIWVEFTPEEVERLASGEYYVRAEKLVDRSKNQFAVSVARDYECLADTRIDGELREVAIVEPVRPRCVHYLRILTDISADRARRYLTRSCMAQKSDTGEYVSVGDAAIFACGIRSPRHADSEAVLDSFDDLSMQKSVERQKVGAFDVDRELEAESKSDLGILGS